MESEDAHGCHDRRTLPDVYFLAGYQGEKVNTVYFSAGFEAFKYTSQRSGVFSILSPLAENIRFQKRTVSGASPAHASNPKKNVPYPLFLELNMRIRKKLFQLLKEDKCSIGSC